MISISDDSCYLRIQRADSPASTRFSISRGTKGIVWNSKKLFVWRMQCSNWKKEVALMVSGSDNRRRRRTSIRGFFWCGVLQRLLIALAQVRTGCNLVRVGGAIFHPFNFQSDRDGICCGTE